MGVTRKMILNYEDCGLLVPSLKIESSGYRYYSADNLTQIRLIRVLQDLGLSLTEIKGYLYDNSKLTTTIERLEQLRYQLDASIVKLRVRADSSTNQEICWTILQRQTMFCRRIYSENIAERTIKLRETYIEAVRTFGIKNNANMFIEYSIEDERDCLLCIPVEDSCKGENIQIFPEIHAICLYHRGSYESIPSVRERLFKYIEEKDLKNLGVSRSIFMEGPPNRGNDTDNYITQIAVPVYDVFDGIPRG